MDYPTGLMMTAVALYQEAETPLGEVAYFRPQSQTSAGVSSDNAGSRKQGMAADIEGKRQHMIDSIRQTYEEYEQAERKRLPEERQQIYVALRQMAEWFERGRFTEEEEENG